MVGDLDEEWDSDFWEELSQVEKFALSSCVTKSSTSPPHPQQPPPPPPPPPPAYAGNPQQETFSYSPPRELSQRIPKRDPWSSVRNDYTASSSPHYPRSSNAEEAEVDKLKRELGRVRKQLSDLQQQWFEIKKETVIKEKRTASAFSDVQGKDAEAQCGKLSDLGLKSREYAVSTDNLGKLLQCENPNYLNNHVTSEINLASRICKTIGVQTDQIEEAPCDINKNRCQSTQDIILKRFIDIWGCPSGLDFGKDLVSKLFAACARDFYVLFAYLGMRMPEESAEGTHAAESLPTIILTEHVQSVDSSDSSKVSQLYFVLTKIINGMVELEALVECLLDLCHVENVEIVHRSLRILHATLNNISSMDGKCKRRDYLVVEGYCSSSKAHNLEGAERTEGPLSISGFEACHSVCIGKKSEYWDNHASKSIHNVDWVDLFKVMCQIATTATHEHVKLEAVSIMNVILLRSNVYLEREKFGLSVVFESISLLLRKEAGSFVQKQAVHTFYLLLNCPKLLAAFCAGCKKEVSSAGAANAATIESISIIDGLADCITCSGSSIQDLELRRRTITALAFLASSGSSGFEMLSSTRLSRKTTFLTLILQSLVSEIDSEAEISTSSPEIHKERTLLIREALIFLNRLVSNDAYSSSVLKVLTSNRDVMSLTVDVANRLSRSQQKCWHSDEPIRQMRESEIVGLACVFKKRVFTFLGANIP